MRLEYGDLSDDAQTEVFVGGFYYPLQPDVGRGLGLPTRSGKLHAKPSLTPAGGILGLTVTAPLGAALRCSYSIGSPTPIKQSLKNANEPEGKK